MPDAVRIGPYRIAIRAEEHPRLLTEKNRIGEYDSVSSTITIELAQAHESVVDTLVHEIVHSWLDQMGYGWTWTAKETELFTQRLTPLVVGLIRGNPEVVRFVANEE